jgi:hypothetical protein
MYDQEERFKRKAAGEPERLGEVGIVGQGEFTPILGT